MKTKQKTKNPSEAIVSADYPVHEACQLMPLLSEDDYALLKADIEENGQQVPIVICNGKLIDGRHRLKAMLELGRKPRIDELSVDEAGDIDCLVASLNVQRRHLEKPQRAAIAATWIEEERQRLDLQKELRKKGDKNVPPHEPGRLRTRAAKLFKVAEGSIQKATKLRETVPDAFEELLQGKLEISQAEELLSKESPSDEAIPAESPAKKSTSKKATPKKSVKEQSRPKKSTGVAKEGAIADASESDEVAPDSEQEESLTYEQVAVRSQELFNELRQLFQEIEVDQEVVETHLCYAEELKDWLGKNCPPSADWFNEDEDAIADSDPDCEADDEEGGEHDAGLLDGLEMEDDTTNE